MSKTRAVTPEPSVASSAWPTRRPGTSVMRFRGGSAVATQSLRLRTTRWMWCRSCVNRRAERACLEGMRIFGPVGLHRFVAVMVGLHARSLPGVGAVPTLAGLEAIAHVVGARPLPAGRVPAIGVAVPAEIGVSAAPARRSPRRSCRTGPYSASNTGSPHWRSGARSPKPETPPKPPGGPKPPGPESIDASCSPRNNTMIRLSI